MPSVCANHVSGNLSAKPVMTRTMKLVSRIEVLPALIHGHALHEGILHAAARHCLAAPDDGVVQEHGADDDEDEGDVDPPHPTDGDGIDVVGAGADLQDGPACA